MSSELEDRINELEDLVLNRFHEIGKRTGVPFVIFHYPPSSELNMREKIDSFVDRLEYEDIEVLKIDLRELFFSILEEKGLIESVIDVEKEEKDDLMDALRPVFFEGVGEKLGDLPQSIIDMKEEGDIIILYDLGILYPLSSLSTIFTNLENKIDKPVIAFYPSEKEGKKLKFLDETEGSYYRAKVV